MSAVDVVWLAMGAALVAYVVTGGADFGGGIWDLLASGPRRREQREAIEHSIAPIWEANHVWLVFVVVLLFTAFPRAFAAIGTALHVPIAAALVGIVLRGAAFTFRAYGLEPDHVRARWGRVFAWSSGVTPVFLGATLGAASTGAIHLEAGRVTSGFFAGWTTPFALLVGLFAASLFALAAAVYLTVQTEGALQGDFRRRALVAEVVSGALAALVLLRARVDAPLLFEHLASSAFTWPLQIATALAAATVVGALATRRFRLARAFVVAQLALVVIGWGAAMDRHVLLPALSIDDAGAQPLVLRALVPALVVAALTVGPALGWLYRIFASRRAR